MRSDLGAELNVQVMSQVPHLVAESKPIIARLNVQVRSHGPYSSGEFENDSPELLSGWDDGSLSRSSTLLASSKGESLARLLAIVSKILCFAAAKSFVLE